MVYLDAEVYKMANGLRWPTVGTFHGPNGAIARAEMVHHLSESEILQSAAAAKRKAYKAEWQRRKRAEDKVTKSFDIFSMQQDRPLVFEDTTTKEVGRARIKNDRVEFLPTKSSPAVELKGENKPQEEKTETLESQESHCERGEENQEKIGVEAPEEKIDISRPPRRSPLRTKQNWLTLPSWAREDIYAREAQTDSVLAKYSGLGQYIQKVAAIGTTLPAMLAFYTDLEEAFRKDPLTGFAIACQAVGHDVEKVFASVRKRLNEAMAPPEPAPPDMREAAPDQTNCSAPLDRTMELKLQIFGEDERNEFYQIVKDGMVNRIRDGRATKPFDAYQQECADNPIVQEVLMARRPRLEVVRGPLDRARSAAKHTIGAPSRGGDVNPRRDAGANESYEETVRKAVEQQRNR